VVGFMGTGIISYEAALAAAFIEGLIFIFLTVVGLRAVFMELIPRNLLFATAAGIGCFLAFIGLQKSEGLGIITYDGATLVTLGGCVLKDRQHMYVWLVDASLEAVLWERVLPAYLPACATTHCPVCLPAPNRCLPACLHQIAACLPAPNRCLPACTKSLPACLRHHSPTTAPCHAMHHAQVHDAGRRAVLARPVLAGMCVCVRVCLSVCVSVCVHACVCLYVCPSVLSATTIFKPHSPPMQAWRDNDTANSLTCGTCTKAFNYLVNDVGLTPPVNMVEACQQYIFSFAPDGNIAPAVQLGLPPRSANYYCGNVSRPLRLGFFLEGRKLELALVESTTIIFCTLLCAPPSCAPLLCTPPVHPLTPLCMHLPTRSPPRCGPRPCGSASWAARSWCCS
jgi:hypothetical protein